MKSAISNLALIPARAGSKRLPRKNILPFAGKPMLAWTVEAARESNLFDVVLVSTDDEQIAAVARSVGADVLMRPEQVSNDAATLVDVIQHMLENIQVDIKQICLLLANCPLRNAQNIRDSADIFETRNPSALLSVVNYGWTPPFRALRLTDHKLEPVFDDWIRTKSQNYPEAVCPSGAIYWSTPAVMRNTNTLYVDGLEGFPLAWHRGIDIDTEQDMVLAACIRDSLDRGYDLGEKC